MWKSRHSTNHVPSGDRFPVKDYGLGQKKEFEVVMSGMLKGGNGGLREANAVLSASVAWDIMLDPAREKRERKDLHCLYGMSPVPENIYKMMIKADSEEAGPDEIRILEQYIKEKKFEIRKRKMEIGAEGKKPRRYLPKMAGDGLFNIAEIFKTIKEDEYYDEQ